MTWEELETYNNGEIWNELNLKIEDDYYNGDDIICDINGEGNLAFFPKDVENYYESNIRAYSVIKDNSEGYYSLIISEVD